MPTSSGIGARPATARSRSYMPSLSSKANVLTPSPPVATNRAAKLRQNARREAEVNEEWMLKETREYLERSSSRNTKKKSVYAGECF